MYIIDCVGVDESGVISLHMMLGSYQRKFNTVKLVNSGH